MEKIFIVFAKENFEASQKIERALTTKANIKSVAIDASKPLSSIENEIIKENDCKVILIISDNFLKTESCMNAALPFIQTLEQTKRLLIVSADGVSTDAYGTTKYTTTSFDRVSQVIQYMNFWQEKFLEVRAISRNMDNQLNDKSKVVRNISTEVGEILRLIRPLDNFQLKELEQNGYSTLMSKLNFSKNAISNEVLPAVNEIKASQPSYNSSLHSDNATLVSNGFSQSNGNVLQNGFKKEIKNSEESFFVNEKINQDLAHAPSVQTEEVSNHSLPLTLESLIENNKIPASTVINHLDEETLSLKNNSVLHDVHSNHVEETPEKLPEFIDSTDFLKNEEAVEHTNNATPENVIHTPEKVMEMENHTGHSNGIENETKIAEHATVTETKELNDNAVPVINNEPLKINPEPIHAPEVSQIPALSSIDERFKYANALVDLKNYDEASEQLDIIVGEDRTYVNAYMLAAYIAEQKGDYSLSQSTLEKVTLLQPNYPGIYFKLGKLTEEHLPKQLKKAGRFYKEAINVEPQNYLAHWNFYRFNQKYNFETTNSIEDLKHIVSLKSDFGDAHFELAQQYLKLSDIVNANASYNAASEASPNLKTEQNNLTFKLPEPIKPKNDNGIVVLITGGTSGIGKATAEIFAKAGYRVIITGRREERLENLTKELFEAYDNYNLALHFDVRDNAQVEKTLGQLTEDWRNIDILINNAGLASGLAPIHEGLLSDWEAMIDTNIKGLLYITRVVAPIMVAKNAGHIINICSIAGKEVYPNGNVYCATKAAVDTLTRSMRVDLFKHNIRVSQIAPGLVEDTEFSLVRFHGDAERANIYTDIKPLNAADVADTIYYMATRPPHVTIQDVLIMPTQQAGANFYNRNGR